ncbi:2-deoxy-D-gluconate 3-dehydrogenase [Blastomyces silverae]|uniref:2-deoxy-D-gluconate 3-dehydrogenase n=1 Tax=Blastomyces silverae TaxID=2060906 RepID=A0A0H1B7G2_9EURO|nr:2-deoxy-D-gluconate 3-dehydrogenase [Blastomyces silverae]
MTASLFDLTGKTALVTGATRGIGQAMAIALAEAGADIILIRGSSPDTTTREAIEKTGRKCHSYQCNLADKAAVAGLISAVTAEHKTVNILVNAAGIQRRCEAENFPQEAYEEVMQVNLNAPFTLCRDMGKYWIENNMRGCKIINVASLCTFFGSVKIPAYSMSKGGIGQLTKALSNEWASKGINVNAIAPGYVATDINRDTVTGDPAYLKSITDRIPAGHWGKPEDMKGPVVFLASEASSYVNGEILTVDGGFCGR